MDSEGLTTSRRAGQASFPTTKRGRLRCTPDALATPSTPPAILCTIWRRSWLIRVSILCFEFIHVRMPPYVTYGRGMMKASATQYIVSIHRQASWHVSTIKTYTIVEQYIRYDIFYHKFYHSKSV